MVGSIDGRKMSITHGFCLQKSLFWGQCVPHRHHITNNKSQSAQFNECLELLFWLEKIHQSQWTHIWLMTKRDKRSLHSLISNQTFGFILFRYTAKTMFYYSPESTFPRNISVSLCFYRARVILDLRRSVYVSWCEKNVEKHNVLEIWSEKSRKFHFSVQLMDFKWQKFCKTFDKNFNS